MEKSRLIDIKGQRFGNLVVIDYLGLDKNSKSRWLCQCDCGNTTVTSGVFLRRGHTKSCGCRRNKTLYKHGLSYDPIYKAWIRMKQRCDNPTMERYERYGGRRITYCKEWQDFDNFYKWSLDNGWKNGLTLDRINNDGNYEPSNCRWADRITQQNNTSFNHIVEYKGEKYTIAQLARKANLPYGILRERIRKKWEINRAVETPVNLLKSHKKTTIQTK